MLNPTFMDDASKATLARLLPKVLGEARLTTEQQAAVEEALWRNLEGPAPVAEGDYDPVADGRARGLKEVRDRDLHKLAMR